MANSLKIKKLVKIDQIEEIDYNGFVYGLRIENDPSYCLENNIVTKNSDLPDIDLDIEDTKRDLAKEHLQDLYGHENVAEISTFMKMKPKSAIKDVARVFDVPFNTVNNLTSAMNDYSDTPIEDVIEETDIGKEFNAQYPDIIELAKSLNGQCRSASRHAAAVVVSSENLMDSNRCNLCTRSKQIVVNWDMNDAEYCGLMKLDLLGLKTLTVINETLRLIKKPIDLDNIPLDDENIFKDISNGNTVGVFQISAKASTEMAMNMGVNKFMDIVDLLALVRPGAADSGMAEQYIERKKGIPLGKTWKRKHDIYEKITERTYSQLIYQEQIMKVISEVAGLSYSVADKIRKIIGKKRDPEEFKEYWEMFLEGCLAKQTMLEGEAEGFWKGLQDWAKYGFSIAHSVAYALIAYQTAWLKHYYPVEFICASLTYGSQKEDKISDLIGEANRLKLKLVPPKLGTSDSINWTVKDDKLYIPFIQVKGIGEKFAAKCQLVKEDETLFDPSGTRAICKTGSKNHKILTEVGAYLKDDYPDTAQAYFDFSLSGEMRDLYPKLVEVIGYEFENEEMPDIMKLDIDPLPNMIKKKRWRIEDEVLDCKKCNLYEESNYLPVPSSSGLYNVAILGEAPGYVEARKGVGFVGKAGADILWPELKKYDLNRRLFHISNVNRCWPAKTKTPGKKQIKACLPFFKKELSEINCRLVLALGKTPLFALTGKDGGIMARAATTEWVEDIGAWVCWCLHPASCLYNPENKTLFALGIENFVYKLRDCLAPF